MPKNPTYSRQGSSIGPTRDTTIDDNNPRQGNNLSDGAVNNPTMQDYYDTVQRGYKWYDTIFNPQKVQDYEFAQNMIAADMQNQYNSETAKMARGRAAGISSSAMAAGIAGAGGSEMQQVSPGTPPETTNPISAAADVGSTIAGVASGAESIASAVKTGSMLGLDMAKASADIELVLSQSGLNKWQAKSIAETLPCMTANQRADFFLKLGNIKLVGQQYENLVAEHNKIVADIELTYANASVAEKQAAVLAEDARYKKATNDLWDEHHYDRTIPSDAGLQAMIISGNYDGAEKVGDGVAGFYSKTEGAKAGAQALATWWSRPDTPTAAASAAANTLVQGAKNPSTPLGKVVSAAKGLFNSGKELLSKIRSSREANAEFEQAYSDAKEDLEMIYKDRLRAYKRAERRGEASAKMKMDLDEAQQAFENFTREVFSQELVNQISPK